MSGFLAALGSVAVLLGFSTAVLGFLNQRRIGRAAVVVDQTAARLQQVSVSVDGQMSGLILRIDQLVSSMQHQGATVPPPPSGPDVAEAVRAKNGA
jgi:hypothetical protein